MVEYLFRSDGRYQIETRSTDPTWDSSFIDRGRYEVNGQTLTLMPYDYFGEPPRKQFNIDVTGDSLTIETLEFPLTQVFIFKPGSRASVLEQQNARPILTGSWSRHITFWGTDEYTFRPGGYFIIKSIPESDQLPPEYVRGRYQHTGNQLTMKPYSGIDATYELDFFGNTMTLLKADGSFGESRTFELIPGSPVEVEAKAAEAAAFLRRPNALAGTWEIRDGFQTVDLTIRPDGYYFATNDVEILRGLVHGRYTLEPEHIHFFPFLGQDIYSRDNGEFGKVERIRAVDYYEGQLHLIDLEALSQWVTLGRKRPGSEAEVVEKVRAAQAERAREGWHIGIWMVQDPSGWLEFTFRPDGRYILKTGTAGVPGAAERGQYVLTDTKLTLAPYTGLGTARGFEWDLYDGNLFLVGDSHRLVVARKIPDSDVEVIEKTRNPVAMKGERGGILGLWTANTTAENVELIFRPDGQFRLTRCSWDVVSRDYGLYTVDMNARTLVYDSRFTMVQHSSLDFYGDTMTIYGGGAHPRTYKVNLGMVDAAIDASRASDAQEAMVDAQWLAKTPIGPRDPNAVHVPVGNIPADPTPGLIFDSPTVFTGYQMYRRLIPGFVYFTVNGDIRSVSIVNTREWHFFPTGRVLVRFTNHRVGGSWPTTAVDVSDSWGAYTIGPKPAQQDILHIFADNSLFLQSDLGEQIEFTLEDGRRNLFWGKDYQLLSTWAAEQKSIPCQIPAGGDASLYNSAVSLSTQIPPDEIREGRLILFNLSGPVSGHFTISGNSDTSGTLVIERATSLTAPISWQAVQTNDVTAGPFSFQIPHGTNPFGYFRVRAE